MSSRPGSRGRPSWFTGLLNTLASALLTGSLALFAFYDDGGIGFSPAPTVLAMAAASR